MENPRHDYSAQWKNLKGNIAAFWVYSLGGFFALPMLSHLFKNAIYLFGPLWFIGNYIFAGRVNLFRCPHCGERFFKPNAWSVNPYLSRCPHCGLEKWTNYS